MNKCFSLFVLIVGLTVAYAPAQTPSQNQPVQRTSQASQATQLGQSSSAGQPGAVTPAQKSSPTSVPGGAADAPGAAMTGSAAVNTGRTQVTENPGATLSDSDLQSQIQQALNKEPTLAGDTVNARVSDRSIDISGNVGNAKQKLTATRIAESYAENRKVEDHLTIGNTSSTAASPAAGEIPPDRPDLSSHPEPEKGSAPGTSTRPPQ
jgi:BON domain